MKPGSQESDHPYEPSDDELFRRYAEMRDQTAYDRLYKKNYQRGLNFVRARLSSGNYGDRSIEPDDLVQSFWTRLLNVKAYDEGGSFNSYYYQSLLNAVRSNFGSRHSRNTSIDDPDAPDLSDSFSAQKGLDALMELKQIRGKLSLEDPKLFDAAPVSFRLPDTLPRDRAIELELVEGVLIFRASQTVRDRIETLLDKQHSVGLTEAEEQEMDQYEELDDYLSYQNRLTRNHYWATEGKLGA